MAYVPATPDPAHPDRPTHPDFALLSAISQDLDGDINGAPRYPGDDVMAFARALDIDVESVEYLIMERCLKFAQELGGKPGKLAPALGASMLNGVVLGIEFWRLRDQWHGDSKQALSKLLDDLGVEL